MRCIIAIVGFLSLATSVFATEVSDLQTDASRAMASSDYDAALKSLIAALAIDPDDSYTNYLAALAHTDGGGDPGVALSYLETAAANGAQPQAVSVLRARLLVAQDKRTEALSEIESLADAGFAAFGRIDGQSDFAPLRGEPRFQAALQKIRAARYPCDGDDRHRAFDFWIGEWDVFQNGALAGRNRITSILGGCLIFEEWESASGGLGKSFNYYDPGEDHWRQIWVADSGTFVEFTGAARDGGIFYTAETSNPATGQVTYHRFEFTEHPDGGIRQFWATSPDREEWTTVWDAQYVKRAVGE